MSIDIFSVIPLLLITFSGNDHLEQATGFLWRDGRTAQYYLVTNYHVLSGKHPNTEKVSDPKGRTPTSVRVFHNSSKPGEWKPKDYPVIDKDNHSIWREHPRFGHQVDVVLHPIDLPPGTTGYAINDQQLTELRLQPAETVSIVGFPFGQTAGHLLAIWQTGHVASEFDVDFENLPAFLVDSRAWPGNSGSPVISRRYNTWAFRDGTSQSSIGYATDFIGIYSGRFGNAEMKYVWKRRVIEEILQ